MKTVLIINHTVENCGVYQYGKRVGRILEKSKDNRFVYLEIGSREDFIKEVLFYNPEIIIYNYVVGTMDWMGLDLFEFVKLMRIKQGLIVHNVGYPSYFDFFLHQDPFYQRNENNYNILRPLFEEFPKQEKTGGAIKIGSFGFGFSVKHFDSICEIVNNEFSSEEVDLRIHTTYAHFGREANEIQKIKNSCISKITNRNINLEITTDFISDEELLFFLSGNDLNIFLYKKYDGYNGISSSIDYALSVEKPIAICESNMFSHIWDANPSILIEKNKLKTIMENGFAPLQEKKNSWSNEKFITHIEEILKNV